MDPEQFLGFPWSYNVYPRIQGFLYFYLTMYPFQMEFHGVTKCIQGSRTIPWISHGQTKLCIQRCCTFVSLCIHFRWNSMELCKCILRVMKCIQGSVWLFWIQNHPLELQSVSLDLFSNFGPRTIPWSHKVYPRIC